MKAAAVFLAILAVAAAVSGATPIGETAPPRRTVHLADPERILGFHSDIVLLDDGSLKVTETIEVIALGREIRRGIYRDFPAPRGSSGKDKESGFKIIEVLREGYTGKRGKRGLDYRSWIDESGRIRFETTRPFRQGECLTILVRWQKGLVQEPTLMEYAYKTIELPPFHGEKKRLAVLDLTMAENIDQALAIPLSDQLRAELFESGRFVIVDSKMTVS